MDSVKKYPFYALQKLQTLSIYIKYTCLRGPGSNPSWGNIIITFFFFDWHKKAIIGLQNFEILEKYEKILKIYKFLQNGVIQGPLVANASINQVVKVALNANAIPM